MADDDETVGGGAESAEECPKCEECKPGLPGWMATFSDMVTLLLTFFVLLLSFAKTETAKYESALGSIRNAFGGNVLVQGSVIERGKSPDDSPTMMESQEPIRPFPIEFLTSEGILDKREINRESTEDLKVMKADLKAFSLTESVNVYEESEGIKVRVKDKIFFEESSTKIKDISIQVFDRIVKLLSNRDWMIFVEGHSSRGEVSKEDGTDAYTLSSYRAMAVTRALIKRGVRREKVTTVFYGDTRPEKISGKSYSELEKLSRRVEFIIRKKDLRNDGHKVSAN